MLNDFTPSGVSQLNLFDEDQPRAHSDELMKVLDRINHSGKGKIWFAGRGITPEWQMKCVIHRHRFNFLSLSSIL